MKTVVIGLLGTTLDAGKGRDRWERWRPTVALCQHEDLLVDRLELLHARRTFGRWRRRSPRDIARVSPETEVRPHALELARPVGLRGGLRRAARLRARLPVRSRARGLPRPHHDRHARRADLPVPADRVAPLPGAAAPDLAAAGASGPASPGTLHASSTSICRSTTASPRASARSSARAASFLKAGIETRNAAFNPLIERIEQVAIALARARSCSWGRPAPASRSWRGASTS